MADMKIRHWRYEDGKDLSIGSFKTEPSAAGWYCWAYPNKNKEFETWMETTYGNDENRARWDHRFNSGDPMYTVYFRDESDAMLFRLRWE